MYSGGKCAFFAFFLVFGEKLYVWGLKLNISCTGLMDGSPNYGMKPMKRVERK